MSSSLESTIIEANAALFERGNLEAINSLFSSNYKAHLTDGKYIQGHASIRTVIRKILTAFGDIEVKVDLLLQKQDRIAWQRTLRGIHHNAYSSFPGTGKVITWRDMVVSRLENGVICEEWVISDLAEQLLLSRKG